MKLLSLVMLSALLSVSACSHFRGDCCKEQKACCKEKKECCKKGAKHECKDGHCPKPKAKKKS